MADVYGVFEGGGAKGIALVGALAYAQSRGIAFRGFAGTSAGAIVASLAAAGYQASDEEARNRHGREGTASWPPPDLKTILTDLALTDFLDGSDTIPLERVRSLTALFKPVLPTIAEDCSRLAAGGWFASVRLLWNLHGLHKRYKAQIDAMPEVIDLARRLNRHKGVYGTGSFTKWLDQRLLVKPSLANDDNEVTFGSLQSAGRTLKVVTADLRKRRARVYEANRYPDIRVSDAVRQSMSIPFFFRPCAEADNYVVDGGVVSNFPAWVFDQEREAQRKAGQVPVPILGFRLVPDAESDPAAFKQQEPPFGAFGRFAMAVFNTLTEGTDEHQTRGITDLVTIDVRVPKNITATTFDLTGDQKEQLYRRGWNQAEDVLARDETKRTLRLP